MGKIAVGRPLLAEEAIQLRARKIVVGGAGVPVQVDGDYLGELPHVFQSSFGELQMVLPQWSADEKGATP